MESKDIIYVLAILVTFTISIVNIISNYRNSRKTTFINSITSERVKWIGNLRYNISLFAGLTYYWVIADVEDTEESKDILKKIDVLRIFIKLQLNPKGEHDQKIMHLIDKIPKLTHETKKEELKETISLLVL